MKPRPGFATGGLIPRPKPFRFEGESGPIYIVPLNLQPKGRHR